MLRTTLLMTIAWLVWISTPATAQKLYWTTSDMIQRADPNGANVETIYTSPSSLGQMVVDSSGQQLFWIELSSPPQRIMRSNLDGSDAQAIWTGSLIGMLAMDTLFQKLYFCQDTASISSVDFDGNNEEHVYTEQPGYFINTLAADWSSGVLYWGAAGEIRMRVPDGGFVYTLSGGSGFIFALTVDSVRSRMHWHSTSTGHMYSAELTEDPSDFHANLVPGDPHQAGIVVAAEPELELLYLSAGADLLQYDEDEEIVSLVVTGVSVGSLGVTTSIEGPMPCTVGSVTNAAGDPKALLYVNGESRISQVSETDSITAYIIQPPAGGAGRFVVHANAGFPDPLMPTIALPGGIGEVCFPMLLSQGASPLATWNNLGRESKIGASQYFDGSAIPDPPLAPALFLALTEGDAQSLPIGTAVTLQGVIMDDGSTSPLSASSTNAVTLWISR